MSYFVKVETIDYKGDPTGPEVVNLERVTNMKRIHVKADGVWAKKSHDYTLISFGTDQSDNSYHISTVETPEEILDLAGLLWMLTPRVVPTVAIHTDED